MSNSGHCSRCSSSRCRNAESVTRSVPRRIAVRTYCSSVSHTNSGVPAAWAKLPFTRDANPRPLQVSTGTLTTKHPNRWGGRRGPCVVESHVSAWCSPTNSRTRTIWHVTRWRTCSSTRIPTAPTPPVRMLCGLGYRCSPVVAEGLRRVCAVVWPMPQVRPSWCATPKSNTFVRLFAWVRSASRFRHCGNG